MAWLDFSERVVKAKNTCIEQKLSKMLWVGLSDPWYCSVTMQFECFSLSASLQNNETVFRFIATFLYYFCYANICCLLIQDHIS